MLKLVNIKKDYVSKGIPTVHALKGLTVNFRRNEFVAILGASGCGKTTLLNIIGGLDRYTSGDLVIEGKSTKDYKDGDWDTYRNHSVGFVFQSYNLIMHQTVLKNVELALTISGIKKDERKQRALDVLKIVGLEGMENKKPNQLSGGQMQRVAIARALINNPEILLADEPTGALDSETSLQIMDLLKEVAEDRLVIMVTHNPDLAYKYATRIVKMSDGLLTDDSDPYSGETKEELKAALKKKEEIIAAKGNKKQSSMSFATATGLSLSNLLSKLKRTILVSVAGSIGIIGVSSVLAVSFGVNNYIDSMQDDMLSQYPVSVSEQAVDYASLMAGLSSMQKVEASKYLGTDLIGVDSMIAYLMEKYNDLASSIQKTNEINQDFVGYVRNMPDDYYASINYNYGIDVTNNIYTTWNRGYEGDEGHDKVISLNGLTQMYISELQTVPNFGQYAMYVNLFTNFVSQLPANEAYIMDQFEFVGEQSRFPKNKDEMIVVVDENQTLTDLLFAQLGYFTEREFLDLAKRTIDLQDLKNKLNEEKITKEEYEQKCEAVKSKYENIPSDYSVSEVLGKDFYYLPHNKMWQKSDSDIPSVKFVVPGGLSPQIPMDMTIVLKYTGSVTDTLSAKAYIGSVSLDMNFVRSSTDVSDPDNPIIGQWKTMMGEQIFEIKILSNGGVEVNTTSGFQQIALWSDAGQSFTYPAVTDKISEATPMKIVGILKKKKNINFGCLSRGIYYINDFAAQFMDDAVDSAIVNDPLIGMKAYIRSPEEIDDTYRAYVSFTFTSFEDTSNPQKDIAGEAMALNQDFNKSLGSMFSISGATYEEIDKVYLRSVSGIATKILENEDGDYLGKEFDRLPESIELYPTNFNNKSKITKYLDKWNNDEPVQVKYEDGTMATVEFKDRKNITYTDTVALIISVIDALITAVTIALIVFTSLSLVVSCFMIAVITYISTMERVKEIGVIRSLGGRKKDVSRLFIAETLIIGLASGVFGILITYLLELILNLSIAHLGVFGIAALPIWMAGIMVVLSITLNVVSGLIPSLKASNQDPVIALRTE